MTKKDEAGKTKSATTAQPLTDIGISRDKSEKMRAEIEKIFESHKLKATPKHLMSIMWSSDSALP